MCARLGTCQGLYMKASICLVLSLKRFQWIGATQTKPKKKSKKKTCINTIKLWCWSTTFTVSHEWAWESRVMGSRRGLAWRTASALTQSGTVLLEAAPAHHTRPQPAPHLPLLLRGVDRASWVRCDSPEPSVFRQRRGGRQSLSFCHGQTRGWARSLMNYVEKCFSKRLNVLLKNDFRGGGRWWVEVCACVPVWGEC